MKNIPFVDFMDACCFLNNQLPVKTGSQVNGSAAKSNPKPSEDKKIELNALDALEAVRDNPDYQIWDTYHCAGATVSCGNQ